MKNRPKKIFRCDSISRNGSIVNMMRMDFLLLKSTPHSSPTIVQNIFSVSQSVIPCKIFTSLSVGWVILVLFQNDIPSCLSCHISLMFLIFLMSLMSPMPLLCHRCEVVKVPNISKVSFKINYDIDQSILPEQLGDRLLMSELILKLTLCCVVSI